MSSQLRPQAVCMSGMPCSNRCEGTWHLPETPCHVSLQTYALCWPRHILSETTWHLPNMETFPTENAQDRKRENELKLYFIKYHINLIPQNPSIQSSPSKQQLSLLSNRWALKPDHWTNGLCCSMLSFLQFPFSRLSQVKLFQVFSRRRHIFLNSWVSGLRGGAIDMPISYDQGKKPALYFTFTSLLWQDSKKKLGQDKAE